MLISPCAGVVLHVTFCDDWACGICQTENHDSLTGYSYNGCEDLILDTIESTSKGFESLLGKREVVCCNSQGWITGTVNELVTVLLVGVTDDVTPLTLPEAGLSNEDVNLSCLQLDRDWLQGCITIWLSWVTRWDWNVKGFSFGVWEKWSRHCFI